MSTVQDHSDRILAEATANAHDEIDEFCAEMVVASSDEAPKDTGNLQQTITHEMVDDLEGHVLTETAKGADLEAGYGFWVHEGHELPNGATVPADPYFRRGYERTKGARRG